MTNNKLHVLCMFAITICTVTSDTNCVMRKDCRDEMYNTNRLIWELTDEQKRDQVKYLIDEFDYEGIMEFLVPPNTMLLSNRDSNDSIYSLICNNEKIIQQKLIEILGPTRKMYRVGKCTYDGEIDVRISFLNSMFFDFLVEEVGDVKMCVNGEKYKCVLVGLLKRTINYQMRNKAQCNDDVDGTCTITTTEWITEPGVLFDELPPVNEYYRDRLHDSIQGYYEILLYDPVRQTLEETNFLTEELSTTDSSDTSDEEYL